MKGKKRPRWIYAVPAVIILIAIVIGVRARQSADGQPEFRTAIVKRGTVTASVSGNGTLQPLTTVEVKSNVGGQIVKLAVDEGDYVRAGQLIARIDPSDSMTALQQAEADLSGARAKVDQARQGSNMQRLQTVASITGAQQSLEASKQRFAQADQQAKIQPKLTQQAIQQARSALQSADATLSQTKTALVPQKLAAAKAAYDQAKATCDQTSKDLARQAALLAKGFVSQSQVDAAKQQYSVAQAQLDSAKIKQDTVKGEAEQDIIACEGKAAQAKAALDIALSNGVQDTLKKQDRLAAQAALKQATAALASANAAAYQDQMKRGDILQAQAQLARAAAAEKNSRTQLGYTTINSPCTGVVVKKYVEEGSIVTAGRSAFGGGTGAGITIVDIADVSRVRVVVNVDETDIARIRLGQEVDVTVDAYPDELFGAKVIKIAPEAMMDQNVTTVPVTVELSHPDRRLKPAMNATCDFVTTRKQNVLYVPSEAVKETDKGMTVTVLDHGKQVERRVEVGITGNDYSEIVSGLRQGETVITTVIQPLTTPGATPGGGAGGGRGGPRMF